MKLQLYRAQMSYLSNSKAPRFATARAPAFGGCLLVSNRRIFYTKYSGFWDFQVLSCTYLVGVGAKSNSIILSNSMNKLHCFLIRPIHLIPPFILSCNRQRQYGFAPFQFNLFNRIPYPIYFKLIHGMLSIPRVIFIKIINNKCHKNQLRKINSMGNNQSPIHSIQ